MTAVPTDGHSLKKQKPSNILFKMMINTCEIAEIEL